MWKFFKSNQLQCREWLLGCAAATSVLPARGVKQVLEAFPASSVQVDKMVSASNNSGLFSILSAYQIVRQADNVSRLFSSLWHQALHQRFPFS